MTEEQIRVIAREEAQRVLREFIKQRAAVKEARLVREERLHAAALAEAYGPHGQG